jgi:hypothetical protein
MKQAEILQIDGENTLAKYSRPAGVITKNNTTAGPVVIADIASPELSTDVNGTTADGEVLTVGASSVQSAAIVGNFIDVTYAPTATTTLGCYVELGFNPTAQAGSYYIASNTTYRFSITSGNKIACLQIAAGGSLYIHPVE